MTSLFPHPDHAEIQPYGHTILTLHVLARGFLSGSFISLFFTGGSVLLNRSPGLPLSTRILSNSARGTLWGTGLIGLALIGRMWDREDIEWKDRSWRLLGNEGEMKTDWWQIGGATLGAAVALGAGKRVNGAKMLKGWEKGLGGAGLGSFGGMIGYHTSKNIGSKVKQ
ncbi:hypothetical protein EJ05DRAFT_471915 [Pseudovirgaria hyperparasitica]|uniref:Uncharacterized protein n=1 Tax=Pseudovirgaria hyperparasitica TaxID=470096 RepID=A0A6A6WLR6_9PEZI|nr:uncharacterized protein EJ05DRAFT_471915 [Pseudovirgaria hyperparasitica]KAF2762949.1 hypothetical protein EJ05DRAFT_471915 [Pseudovirgaria hyperparasitica]